jgi:hypothetical protein
MHGKPYIEGLASEDSITLIADHVIERQGSMLSVWETTPEVGDPIYNVEKIFDFVFLHEMTHVFLGSQSFMRLSHFWILVKFVLTYTSLYSERYLLCVAEWTNIKVLWTKNVPSARELVYA